MNEETRVDYSGDGRTCPSCTFINPPQLVVCEICQTPLPPTQPTMTAPTAVVPSTAVSVNDLTRTLFNFGLRGPADSDDVGDRRGGGGRERRGRGRGGRDGGGGDRGGRRMNQTTRNGRNQSPANTSSHTSTTSSQIDDTFATRGTWQMKPKQTFASSNEKHVLTTTEPETVESTTNSANSISTDAASVQTGLSSIAQSNTSSSTTFSSSTTTSTTALEPASTDSITIDDDETGLDDSDAAADEARQARGLFERAPDGTIIHRRLPPTKATLATVNPTPTVSYMANLPHGAIASTIPPEITEVGFPDYRWRTSLQTGHTRMLVLCVAEKPSIALTIAQVLSHGTHRTHTTRATPIHEFDGIFNGESVSYRVTSVAGHVYGTDFEVGYEDWEATDPGQMFTAPIRKVCEKGSMRQHLSDIGRGVDLLILWLDCDREGENICFEVMENVIPSMNEPRGRYAKPHPPPQITYERSSTYVSSASRIPGSVLRAKFSALNESDILTALRLDHLVPPNELAARAVDARQEIDLRIGVAFTRFQSRYFLSRYGSALRSSRTISFGPCQTPTLGFCVERSDEIERFIPEPFWQLEVKIQPPTSSTTNSSGTTDSTLIPLQWDRSNSIFDKNVATMFHHLIQSTPTALVESVQTVEKRRSRPTPLNTVELLKVCSKQLGIGPHDAMRVAEHLYMGGYISYPRTETSAYPHSFDLVGTVRIQQHHSLWGEFAQQLLSQGRLRNTKGVDAGDHPPITPMRAAQPNQLSGADWRVYEYITRHFLATVSEDAKQQITTTKFRVGETEYFTANTTEFVEVGFMGVMPWLIRTDDISLGLKVGDRVPLHTIQLRERMTEPPGYLTESDLISRMEQFGIGTDASIPMHIKSILDRGYVVLLGSGRTLRPTELGSVLIHGYQSIDPELCAPQLRGSIEKELSLIVDGVNDYPLVVRHALEIFARKFAYLVEHIEKMNQLVSMHFQMDPEWDQQQSSARTNNNTDLTQPPLPDRLQLQCGKCHHWMKFHDAIIHPRTRIATTPPRLHCPTCDEIYLLPTGGTIKKYLARTCPLDGFELILFTMNSIGKDEPSSSYTLCPYCYTRPPFVDDSSVPHPMSCSHCLHPTCRYSLSALRVTRCPQFADCGGQLVLDPIGGPNWRLGCNQCNCIITFAQSAYSQSTFTRTSAQMTC